MTISITVYEMFFGLTKPELSKHFPQVENISAETF